MDLRSYYKKVREAEATLTGNESVLVSLATSGSEKRRANGSAARCRSQTDRRRAGTCRD